MKILFIEDDLGLALPVSDLLQSEGYEVSHFENGDNAVDELIRDKYDLVLLDLMLRGKSGYDICIEIRKRFTEIPIMMLTALSGTDNKVTGFKLGADDYVTKPFESPELIARIEALLRRSSNAGAPEASKLVIDNIEMDFIRMEVRKDGEVVHMSSKEYSLLKYLALNRGRSISREELLESVWGYDSNITTRTIDTHMGWLRRKLEEDPKNPVLITTICGFGYMLAK